MNLKKLIRIYQRSYLSITALFFVLGGLDGLLISQGLVFLYWLSGFLPGQRIDLQNNRFHAWGIGNKVLGWIDGDRRWFPWVSRPWPLKPITLPFPNKWNVFSNEPHPELNSSKKHIEYKPGTLIPNLGFSIDKATDYSNKIRKKSRYIFRVPISLPLSTLTFDVLLPTLFDVFQPMDILKLEGNTLEFAQGEVIDAIDPWFTAQEKKWYKKWKAAVKKWEDETDEKKLHRKDGEQLEPLEKPSLAIIVLQEMESIRIDDLGKIQIPFKENGERKKLPFREYLDTQKFKQFGFRFGEQTFLLGYGKAAMEIQESRKNQQLKDEDHNLQVKNEKVQAVKRVTSVNDAKAQAEATEIIWEKEKEVVKGKAAAQAKINGAYKAEVLMLGEKGQIQETTAATTTALRISEKLQSKKQTGGNDGNQTTD